MESSSLSALPSDNPPCDDSLSPSQETDDLSSRNGKRTNTKLALAFLCIEMFLVLFMLTSYSQDLPIVSCLALGFAPAAAYWIVSRKLSIGLLRCGVGFALILYLIRKNLISFESISLLKDHWEWLALGLILAPAQPLLGSLRWRQILRSVEINAGYMETFRLTLSGTFFNLFVPGSTGGDALRAAVIGQTHRSWTKAISSVALDRILGLPPLWWLIFVTWLLQSDFLSANPEWHWLSPLVWGGLILSSGGLIALLFFGSYLARKYGHLEKESGWRKTIGNLSRLAGEYGNNHSAIAWGLVYGFIAHVLTVTQCICFGYAAGLSMEWGRYFLAVPAGLVINAIPLSPGGIGQGEMAFSHFFAIAHPDGINAAATGALIMLCLRFGQWTYGLAGGVVYMAGKHRLTVKEK